LIEDAKADFKGSRQEAFAWGVYNALRFTDATQLQKLRELLREHRIKGILCKSLISRFNAPYKQEVAGSSPALPTIKALQ